MLSPRSLGAAMAVCALAAAGLVAIGVATTPGFIAGPKDWLGPIAVSLVLLAYAVTGLRAAPATGRWNPDILAIAVPLGLAAGALYAAEIVIEYVLLPTDNTALGLIEFGSVFALFLIGGLVAALRTRHFRQAVTVSVWIALISALLWYLVLMAVFLAFRGTDRQIAVLTAEGDFDDMRRSGMTDLAKWVMQDMIGAGFFHLLLSPLFAAILGSLGAGIGLAVARLRNHR